MSRARSRAPLAFLVLVSCLAPVAGAGARELAHGRPVRFTIPPNYARTVDPLDSLQLTDRRSAASAWIWLDRQTVGWDLQPGAIVGLVIDLGRSATLDSIIVHSAWFPRSGVLPPSIVCAAGDDAAHLVRAGALDASGVTGADSTRAQRVRLAVPVRGARGRTVVVAALLQGEFLFVDEIEVWGEESGAERIAEEQVFALRQLHAVCAAERRAWAASTALPEAALPRVRAPSEAARLAARAAGWRRARRQRVEIRRVDPWAPLTPWSAPHPARNDTLQTWPGAWSAAAIDIASCDSLASTVAVEAEPPAAGAPRAALREVVPVEARPGRWAGDALPLARESLAVRSGEVRQLWVDVDASGASPGLHRVVVRVGSERVEIPVRVHPIRLAAPPLAALDWTYPEHFALGRTNAPAAVLDNRAHGIDSWWLQEEAVPWPEPGTIDASGRLARPPEFGACDTQLPLYRGGANRWLGWYLNFDAAKEDPSRGRFRHPFLSSAWKLALTGWLDMWLGRLESQGLARRAMFLQLFDETTAARAESCYQFLHGARPDVRLALTVTRLATPADLRRIGKYLGLAIIEREALPRHVAWIDSARARGVEVWAYDVPQPSKLADPTHAYRGLVWEAWARRLSGVAFWSWGDTGTHSADAWDDFDSERSDYAVVYGAEGAPRALGAETFAPSKRWQAFRIGMQESALLEAALAKRPGLRDEILAAIGRPGFDPEAWRAACVRALDGGRDD